MKLRSILSIRCWAMVLLIPAFASTDLHAAVRYVALDNPTPSAPYTNWIDAATNIQDAIDAADAGDTVLVSNGVYDVGGRVAPGSLLTNRVVIDKPITVTSVNGAEVTSILGNGPNGDDAVRCVWMTDGVTLVGFTLANGATRDGGDTVDISGGGLWAQSTAAVVSNCTLNGNTASEVGGGSYFGTLNNCMLTANSAFNGGGAYLSEMNHCTLTGNMAILVGGGVSYGVLNHCTLTGNTASSEGGGAYFGTLTNCMLSGNSAGSGGGASASTLNNCTLTGNRADFGNGGGASGGELNNCTLTGNSAGNSGGGADFAILNNCTLTGNTADFGSGGGASGGELNNCIVYFNTASTGTNYADGVINYTCTTPLPAGGVGNFTNEPMFVSLVATNLALSANSPCRDTGNNANAPAGSDLAGNPRIVNGVVDRGAYEVQDSPSPDYDGDGLSNADEIIAGSSAVDANDVWEVDAVISPASVRFPTRLDRLYAVDRNDNLLTAPQVWTEFTNNIPGTGGAITINDPLSGTIRNYRVRVGLAP